MTFDELVLQNVGAFGGKHSIDLRLEKEEKPIILFGALNGSGKTTILNSMILALLGSHSPFIDNGNAAYQAYLKGLTHRGTGENSDGSSIELSFTINQHGQKIIYSVTRQWSLELDKLRNHSFKVKVDGEFDEYLTENWESEANQFIPASLASLFFFDGERIESLADEKHSSKILKKAIDSLLGIDLIEQLDDDLVVIDRKNKKTNISSEELTKIDLLEKEIVTDTELLSIKKQEEAKLNVKLDNYLKKISLAKRKFESLGGDYKSEHDSLTLKKNGLESKIKHTNEQLVELYSSDFPLSKVKDKLAQLKLNVEESINTDKQKDTNTALKKYENSLLKWVLSESKAKDFTANFEKEIERNRLKREKKLKSNANFYPYNPEILNQLNYLLSPNGLNKTEDQYSVLKNKLTKEERSLSGINKLLSKQHDDDAINTVKKQLSELTENQSFTKYEKNSLLSEIDSMQRQLDMKRVRLEKAYENNNDILVSQKRSVLLKESIKGLKEYLAKYSIEKTASSISMLENLIKSGLDVLIRKKKFINKVEIDPLTYELRLYKDDTHAFDFKNLSAGERQLIAISILWALARASERALPVAIDTPLGRLDGVHRKNITENYFPKASHQVFIFSTDEEIDSKLLRTLNKHVSRTYTISYDSKIKSSSVKEGYFV